MHADLEQLIALEKAEKEIARLSEEIAALPKRVTEIEAQLNDSKKRAEEARQALKAQEMKKRSLESDIQSLQQKVSKFRDQSLEVKTNEQYKALMHEIEFAQKQIREHEDTILEGMESAEHLEKSLKTAEAELKGEAIEIEKESAHARSLTAEDEKQLAQWSLRRKELRSGISSPHLLQYDHIFKLRKNAIVEAIGQKCSACFVLLRPQKWNEVKTNAEIQFCDSCGRILYYDPEHEPVVEAKPGKSSKRKKSLALTEDSSAAVPESSSIPEEQASTPSS